MQNFLLVLATAASFASAETTASASSTPSLIGAVVPIGQQCDPKGTPCALGADCYATNSMLMTICGNFQATCTSDQQCAFNKCNDGACNGELLSSSSAAEPSTATSAAPAATSSSACPAPGDTDSQGRYSCNPAHQYPSGQECVLVDGCYFLSTTLPTSSAHNATSSMPYPTGSHSSAKTSGVASATQSGKSSSTHASSPPIYTGAALKLGPTEATGFMAGLFAAMAWVL